MLILFPKRVIYLLKPTDSQRIVQVLRELVVLNVVGSNPTSHPKKNPQLVLRIFLFKAILNNANILYTPLRCRKGAYRWQ